MLDIFKVYFDGHKFVVTKFFEGDVIDIDLLGFTEYLFYHYESAISCAENLNKNLKSDYDHLIMPDDFMVVKCKDCKNYYILSKSEIDWFLNRDLFVPCRCYSCRIKRRRNNEKFS